MSAELHWSLVRNHHAYLVKRSGVLFSCEPGNLACKHSYKYSGLAQPKPVIITANAAGVLLSRRSTKAPCNKIAGAFVKPSLIKKNADGKKRACKVARDMQATGYRLDLIPQAQAKVIALLQSYKPRKYPAPKTRGKKSNKVLA